MTVAELKGNQNPPPTIGTGKYERTGTDWATYPGARAKLQELIGVCARLHSGGVDATAAVVAESQCEP